MTEAQIQRYARHILLPEIGGRGQARLLAGAVGVEVRGGGAAAVAALAYLAAAGVGRLVLAGDPHGLVDERDVASGVLYAATDVGRPRLAALRARIAELNPDVEVIAGAPDDPGVSLWLDGVRSPAAGDGATVAAALVEGGRAAARGIARLAAAP